MPSKHYSKLFLFFFHYIKIVQVFTFKIQEITKNLPLGIVAMEETIINRVTNSGLVSFDLEDFYHTGERIVYDLKDNLFMGLILKEKDFREFLKNHDWTQYSGKNIAITCSEDAIVPTWAYMLVAIHLEPHANMMVFGNLDDLERKLYEEAISKIDFDEYTGKRVVIKGCSKVAVPTAAYVDRTKPHVWRAMQYGSFIQKERLI
jgi:hypothetical protein